MFQITDYLDSGIDITRMSVGMVVYDGDTTKTKRVIVPAFHNGIRIELLGLVSATGVAIYKSDLYSRYLGDGVFSITMPHSLALESSEPPYQVFLFKYEVNQIGLSDIGTDIPSVTPIVSSFNIIVIDEGTLLQKDSFLPTFTPTSVGVKSGGTAISNTQI